MKTFKCLIGLILMVLLLPACKPPAGDEALAMTAELTFMGRASVRIDYADGTVIYIDPAYGMDTAYEKEADLVLVTHQHSDHNKTDLVTLKDQGRIINCPVDIRVGQVLTLDHINDKYFKVEAVEAYNAYHSKDTSCGYVITYGDLVIYHSGDTSTTEQMAHMSDFQIDYALLCMDGYYNMDHEEAGQVARMIEAMAVIPIHPDKDLSYNQFVAEAFDFHTTIILRPRSSTQLRDLHGTK